MNPQHDNPDPERPRHDRDCIETRAHAPYNFVPLPEAVVYVNEPPPQDKYHADCYTGYIECTITTLSPLYTRCAMNPDFFKEWGDAAFHELPEAQKNERARFFSLEDIERPVIPGSSLRGMVRTLVEIAGYGKISWVTSESLVFRAVGDPSSLGVYYREKMLGKNKATPPDVRVDYPSLKLKGGYLRKDRNGWAIQPAIEHPAGAPQRESFVHVAYEDAESITHGHGKQRVYDVWVKSAPRIMWPRGRRGPGNLTLDIATTNRIAARRAGDTTPPTGMVAAKLIESGHMSGAHPKHLHCAIYEPDPSVKWVPIPDELWKRYIADRDATRGFETRKLQNDGDPLFYLVNNGHVVFFGPTMMFRLPYDLSPYDFIPVKLREGDTDLAEAIFGYVPDEKREKGLAGRVFFTDALFESAKDGIWETTITPKILSSPKPTTFQHYLVQDRDKGHDPNEERAVAHYATPTPEETVIRGHKLYWHQGPVNIADVQENKAVDWATDKQHTRIRPVKAGVSFRFKIHFENLRDFELGALLWVLTLPGEQNKQYRHALGMGKPLGMGAAHIQPTLHISDRTSETGRYAHLFEGDDWRKAEAVQDSKTLINAFEKFVLNKMDAAERSESQSLKEIKRIRILLKMLEWPGLEMNLARYMEIELADPRARRGKRNEYAGRPVLPDPLHVDGVLVQEEQPRVSTGGAQSLAREEPTKPAAPLEWKTAKC